MLSKAVLFFCFMVILRCSGHAISPHLSLVEQATLTASTITSSELSTEFETIYRTLTSSTTSHHSVTETDASTITSETTTRHTKVDTYTSVPTESSITSSTTTETMNLSISKETVTEKETVTTTPPQTHTQIVKTGPPKPTCCEFTDDDLKYTYVPNTKNWPAIQIDTTCLHPRFVSTYDPTSPMKSSTNQLILQTGRMAPTRRIQNHEQCRILQPEHREVSQHVSKQSLRLGVQFGRRSGGCS
jgi:hypothetical protein